MTTNKRPFQKIEVSRATGNVVEENSDLVVREITGGQKVLNFTLASNNAPRQGQNPTASYIRVTAFGRDAERLKQYLTKGKPLAVSGRLELRSYPSKKYHDDQGKPAIMQSAELSMVQNGFEFINGGRRASTQQSAAGEAETAEAPVAALTGESVTQIEQPGGAF